MQLGKMYLVKEWFWFLYPTKEMVAEAYTCAVRLAPRHGPDVYLKLGNLHYRRGEAAEARDAWQQVLAMDPTHRLATANLASLERTETAESTGRSPRRLGAVA